MSINPISDSAVQSAAMPKPEAIQAGKQEESTPIPPSAAGKPEPAAHEVLVALKTMIAKQLAELTQTVADSSSLVKSLPPEIRELVQQVLSQNQGAQTALPAGLAMLLKAPRTASENLAVLAELISQAAGLTAGDDGTVAPAAPQAGKQPQAAELARVLQLEEPGELQQTANVLRDLSAVLKSGDNQPRQQSQQPPATPARPELPTPNAQPAAAKAAVQPENPATPTGAKQTVTSQPGSPQPQTGLAAAAKPDTPAAGQQPAALPAAQGDLPDSPQLAATKPAGLAAEPAQAQPAATTLVKTAVQAELLKTLAPQVREIVLTMLAQPEQPGEQALPARQLPGQTTQTGQPQPAGQPMVTARQSAPAGQSQQPGPNGPAGAQQPAVSSQQAGQQPAPSPAVQQAQPAVRPTEQLQLVLPPALAELLPAGEEISPAAKLAAFADILEQASGLLPQKGSQPALQMPVSRQAVLETAELLQEKSPEELKAIVKIVQELVETMPKPGSVAAERQEGQRVLTMTVPLYFGEGQTVYPAHIHVYHQEKEDKKNPGQKRQETWLRICLETENIGMVDAAFHLYDENILDVKLRFTEEMAAQGFAGNLADVKEQLGQLPLTVGEFLVK